MTNRRQVKSEGWRNSFSGTHFMSLINLLPGKMVTKILDALDKNSSLFILKISIFRKELF